MTEPEAEKRDQLIEALAVCIVAYQGKTNRERARLVLAAIESQGFRLVPKDEARAEIKRLRAQVDNLLARAACLEKAP